MEKMTQATFRAYKKDHRLLAQIAKKLKVSKSKVVRMGISLLAFKTNV